MPNLNRRSFLASATVGAAIHDGSRTNADIEEGHKSALLCHLGNIAYRTRQSIAVGPATGRIVDNPAAQALWSREYRDGWAPQA